MMRYEVIEPKVGLVQTRMRVGAKNKCVGAGLAVVLLTAWLFVGVLHLDEEGDSSNYPFIKQVPTFKLIFGNPYVADPIGEEHEYGQRMDGNGDWLPDTPELKEFLAYCKARYGIESASPIEARRQCKTHLFK